MAEDRLSDPASRKNVEALADSFRRVGYQTRKHGGMSGDMHHYPPSQPITVIHSDSGSSLWNGNHRVHAANMAGLDTLPVLVKDYRTNGT